MKRISLLFAGFALCVLSVLAGDGQQHAVEAFSATAIAIGVLCALPVVFGSIIRSLPFGITLATTIVSSALQAAYGTEFKDGSKSLRDLTQQLYESAEFDKLFSIEYTDLTVWEKAISSSTEVTQGFQLPFTESGTFTFDPSTFPLFDIKVDVRLSSHKIKRDWVGFMHKNNVPQTDQEFVKYILNEHIAPQHVEDLELKMAWSGVRVAPTANVAGTAAGAMDGFKKYINDQIDDSKIVTIAMGALPTDPEDMVDYVEEFAKSIANTDKRTPMTLAMNLSAEELFVEGMRIKYHTYYKDNDASKQRVYVRKNIDVMGLAALDDSPKIFCSPKKNLIKAINQGSGPLFNFEQEDRTIKVYGDYMLAYGVWNPKRFYTNDVDLTADQS